VTAPPLGAASAGGQQAPSPHDAMRPDAPDDTLTSAPTADADPARTPRFAPSRPTFALAALGPAFLVLAVALAASATSLGNGFAFDDRWIIQFNGRVHGIGRWMDIFRESYWPVLSNGLYRPLVSVGYALQWTLGKGSPAPYHAFNVAMYVGACLAFWRLALRVLPEWAALVAAALFAAHPVHVEATGNVVGQAEIMCTLLLCAATSLYIGWRNDHRLAADARAPGWARVLALGLLYAGATLYKEQGIVLIALLAAAEVTVVVDPRTSRARAAAVRPLFLAMLLVAVLLLVARWRVLGQLSGDVPISVLDGLSMPRRTVGMLGLVPELARLLLWPAALSADYGPRHVTFVPSFTPAAVVGLVIALGVIALAVRARRVQPAVAFGIAWLAVTWAPVSNVLVPSGILLAERTLFAPSAGVVLAVAGLLAWATRREDVRALPPRTLRLMAAMLVLVVVAGTVRSATRQVVWKNNDVLFHQMVEDAPLSARAHYALGGHMFEKGQLKDGEQEWRLAIALDSTAWRIQIDLADRYRGAGLCGPAEPLYRDALVEEPKAERARLGLVVCLRDRGARDEAVGQALQALRVDDSPRAGLRLLRYLRAPNDSAAAAVLGGAIGGSVPRRVESATPVKPAWTTAPAGAARR
jgi:protein O-mannosyl-transferase